MIDERLLRLYRVKTDGRGDKVKTVTVETMSAKASKMDIVESIERDARELDVPVKLHINILLGVRGEVATQRKLNWFKSKWTWYIEELYEG